MAKGSLLLATTAFTSAFNLTGHSAVVLPLAMRKRLADRRAGGRTALERAGTSSRWRSSFRS
jgi:hypothetical protein